MEVRNLAKAADKPLVSILTPSFNQATWIADNLRSVACQTYPSIEHIVMDGGSTDGTVEILEAAGDSVRWRSESDEGQSDAINKAFRESCGAIIGWINSDDAYFDCRVVAEVVEYFRTHPSVDVVYGHAAQTTHDGRIIQILWVPEFDRDLLGALDFIVQPAAFIRRSVLADPMLDESFHFAMDYELWLRLADGGRTLARLDRILAIDRHQAERKSSTIKDVYRENLGRLAATHSMRLDAEWEPLRGRFYRRQRMRGGFLIPTIKGEDIAFTAPEDLQRGLWKRQLFQRRSDWPEEYR
jgi:glycosyltransferase involved in cell wall biosynthesis